MTQSHTAALRRLADEVASLEGITLPYPKAAALSTALANARAVLASPADERAAFEKWALDGGGWRQPALERDPRHGERYLIDPVHFQWQGWLARAGDPK